VEMKLKRPRTQRGNIVLSNAGISQEMPNEENGLFVPFVARSFIKDKKGKNFAPNPVNFWGVEHHEMNIVLNVVNTLNINLTESKRNIVQGVVLVRIQCEGICLTVNLLILRGFQILAMWLSKLKKDGCKNTASSWSKYLAASWEKANGYIIRMVSGMIIDRRILNYGRLIEKTLREQGLSIG